MKAKFLLTVSFKLLEVWPTVETVHVKDTKVMKFKRWCQFPNFVKGDICLGVEGSSSETIDIFRNYFVNFRSFFPKTLHLSKIQNRHSFEVDFLNFLLIFSQDIELFTLRMFYVDYSSCSFVGIMKIKMQLQADTFGKKFAIFFVYSPPLGLFINENWITSSFTKTLVQCDLWMPYQS